MVRWPGVTKPGSVNKDLVSNLDFADKEIADGNPVRAQEHLAVAEHNARKASELSRDCVQKVVVKKDVPLPKPPVIVKKVQDSDGDGIPDEIDRCPLDPEDKDGFQDEDGCPDPDNDQDGILDVGLTGRDWAETRVAMARGGGRARLLCGFGAGERAHGLAQGHVVARPQGDEPPAEVGACRAGARVLGHRVVLGKEEAHAHRALWRPQHRAAAQAHARQHETHARYARSSPPRSARRCRWAGG